MKRKSQTIFCPYCGKPAILRKASDIYKTHTLEEYLYACSDYPACDAYVGVHRGTLLPKGASLIKSFVGNALWPTVILILSGSTES